MLQNLDTETLLSNRWIGIAHALLIVLSLGLPWAYPEDHGNAASAYGQWMITSTATMQAGSFTMLTNGDAFSFIILTIVMVASAVFLWKKWYSHQGAKTAITLFVMLAAFPLLASGAMEKVWLGYGVTLLLCAPLPALIALNWGTRYANHPKGRSLINHVRQRLTRQQNP